MDPAALGRTPISPDRPTGSDIRYDPEFEQLQAEIDKLSLPSASGAVNWEKVALLAAALLLDKSKDLRVACYWALGRLQVRGVEGLAEGLTLLSEMIDHFGDDIFPKRPQGRIAALRWWVERTAAAIARASGREVDRGRHEAATAALERLEAHLRGRLTEPHLLRPIARALEALPVVEAPAAPRAPLPPSSPALPLPSRPPAAEAKAAPPTPAPETAKPPPADPSPAATPAAALAAVGAALEELRRASGRLLELAPDEPLAYRCRRIAAWARVGAPPAASEGRTSIPPPPPQIAEELARLRRNGSWTHLLQSAEQRLGQHMFWLDLQRFSALAAEALGSGYRSVLEVVRQETLGLLTRLPALADLKFSNGVPFADAETREWIARLHPGGPPEAPVLPLPAAVEAPAAAEERERTLAQASALAQAGQLTQAVRLLDAPLRASGSQREALRWRLAVCRLLLGAGKHALALPHTELLLAAVDHHRLESWDPKLALEALEAAWQARRQSIDDADKKRARELFDRIALIDPVRALKIEARG